MYSLMLNDLGKFWKFVFPANLVVYVGMLVYMAFQVYLSKLDDDDHGLVLAQLFIGPVFTILLNLFKQGSDKKDLYGVVMMLLYYVIFFAQGMVNQIWQEKLRNNANKVMKSSIYPFMVVGSIATYGLFIPGSTTLPGRVFNYPRYSDFLMQSVYVTGTWHFIYVLTWMMRKESNSIRNKKLFSFFTVGSLFVYLCHDLWITIIMTCIVHPFFIENDSNEWGLKFTACLFITFFGCEILANLNYYLFVKLYMILCMKKRGKKGSKDGDKSKKGEKKDKTSEEDEDYKEEEEKK